MVQPDLKRNDYRLPINTHLPPSQLSGGKDFPLFGAVQAPL